MKKSGGGEMKLLEKVKELRHIDPIIEASFRTQSSDMDALCVALLNHFSENKRLHEIIVSLKTVQPIVVKVERLGNGAAARHGVNSRVSSRGGGVDA